VGGWLPMTEQKMLCLPIKSIWDEVSSLIITKLTV